MVTGPPDRNGGPPGNDGGRIPDQNPATPAETVTQTNLDGVDSRRAGRHPFASGRPLTGCNLDDGAAPAAWHLYRAGLVPLFPPETLAMMRRRGGHERGVADLLAYEYELANGDD